MSKRRTKTIGPRWAKTSADIPRALAEIKRNAKRVVGPCEYWTSQKAVTRWLLSGTRGRKPSKQTLIEKLEADLPAIRKLLGKHGAFAFAVVLKDGKPAYYGSTNRMVDLFDCLPATTGKRKGKK